MLLTITTTHNPATDLGFLLMKNPDRAHTFELPSGQAHVFYPEASAERCTAALLLDIDPVGLVRGRGAGEGLLDHYVNDRPYVASSFLSVAIAEVFGSALNGRSRERPELAKSAIPLMAHLPALPSRGGGDLIRRLFEPLGYEVQIVEHPLDPQFPEWGQSQVVSLSLSGSLRLADLLSHLYVLVPVLDVNKHYYFGDDEIAKLLRRGEGWLASHPARALITGRYLKRRQLVRAALAQLIAEESPDEVAEDDLPVEQPADGLPGTEQEPTSDVEGAPRKSEETPKVSLHEQRLEAVLAQIRASGAQSVIDLGCGEGRLLQKLMKERQITHITGMDVDYRSLERARERLRLERMPPAQAQRLTLIQGSLVYRDARLVGFDAAAVVEVIEHLDTPRLAAFEQSLFGHARPQTIAVTTPNAEYNVRYASLPTGTLRHRDHRFEWSRAEFHTWAERVANTHGYTVTLGPVGPEDSEVGAPSQIAIFQRKP
jgi:3' terminal RNA ribose 2'-O-methyltransferase Hen1